MGRIARSFRLLSQSWRVLMKDKELLLLPVISGILVLVAVGSFAIPSGVLSEDGKTPEGGAAVLLLLGFYVVTYTIGIFFQAAVVAGASERLSGGNPTLGSALGAAARRFPSILAWGIVAGTVGMVLKSIQERSETLGKIVAGLLGAAWSLVTFFVVPVIVLEGEGMTSAFRRSWTLFKQTWGETVVGTAGLGLASFLLAIPVLGIVGLLVAAKAYVVAAVVGGLSLGLLLVLVSALQGVYLASLHRYATKGEVAEGFDRDVVAGAFRPR